MSFTTFPSRASSPSSIASSEFVRTPRSSVSPPVDVRAVKLSWLGGFDFIPDRLQLNAAGVPRRLPKHTISVTIERLTALDPALINVPLGFVKSKVRESESALQMHAGLLAIDRPRLQEQISTRRDLDSQPLIHMPIHRREGNLPTHVLAVINARTGIGKMFPIHPIVYAVHCGSELFNVPTNAPEPEVKEAHPPNEPSYLYIECPLVLMSLPHIETFDCLHNWMYHHNDLALYNAVAPAVLKVEEPKENLPSTKDLDPASALEISARRMMDTYDGGKIYKEIRSIHGFWKNINALGIQEEPIWNFVDKCWAIASRALEMKIEYFDQCRSLPRENSILHVEEMEMDDDQ